MYFNAKDLSTPPRAYGCNHSIITVGLFLSFGNKDAGKRGIDFVLSRILTTSILIGTVVTITDLITLVIYFYTRTVVFTLEL